MLRALVASRWTLAFVIALLSLPLSAALVQAQDISAPGTPKVLVGKNDKGEPYKLDTGDTAWMLTSSALVLMMTGPGLALFYCGLVRRKNVLATMMQSFILMAAVTVAWALIGYSLAFSSGNAFIGGLDFAMLKNVGAEPCEYASTIPHTTWMVYQLMFAIITPALICGAYAERMKFSAMLVFSLGWLLVIYCPLAHMVWGKGGLFNWGLPGSPNIPALDFAGGTVVHISSGVSALVCALVLGKRLGYGKVPMPPHSVVLSVIGAALLWVGWFGFNAGSALAANSLASSAFVATHFAAATAALGWAFAEWIKTGKPTVLGAISGAVAGLVVITPASGFVTPMAAMIMGLIGGVGCFIAATSLKHVFGYDDSLDAFGVHGVGGTMGAILTGVFATSSINSLIKTDTTNYEGLLAGNVGQLGRQAGAALLTWVIAIVGSLILLKIVDAVIGLRVTEADEYDGLDLSQHGESGYNMEDASLFGAEVSDSGTSGSAASSAATARAEFTGRVMDFHARAVAWTIMGEKRQPGRLTTLMRRFALPRRRPPGHARPDSLDWPAWVALIERQRRSAQRDSSVLDPPQDYFVRATCSTFRLDGIDVSEQDVIDAVTHGSAQRKLRSRSSQYIRNHVAMLLSIERAIRGGVALKAANVLRWYTLVGSGLPMNGLSADKMARLEQTVSRINSPQLRLQPALIEVTRTYWELLSDPLFPSFNGILSRLLLRYHLGRCGLPCVVLDDLTDRAEQPVTLSLLAAIDQSYDQMSS